MAFDPSLPPLFQQHGNTDARIGILPIPEQKSQPSSAVGREVLRAVRAIDASDVSHEDGGRISAATRSYTPFRPIVDFGTALVGLDAAFIGIAQVSWTEMLRAWVAIPTSEATVLAALSTIATILVLYALGAYRPDVLTNVRILATRTSGGLLLINAMLFAAVYYALGEIAPVNASAGAALQSELLAMVSTVLIGAAFVVSRTVSYSLRACRCFTRRILVVGSGKRARYLKELLQRGSCGLVNELIFVPESVTETNRSNSELGSVTNFAAGRLDELARAQQIDEIVVAIDQGSSFSFEPFITCKASGIPVINYNCFIEREEERIDLDRADLAWLVYSNGFRQNLTDAVLKRALDVIVSALLLLISAPVMMVAIAAIAAGRDGPIFFKQQRVTQNGRLFWLYKIRTMRPDAERNGPQWASNKDPRITCAGAVLRRFRIDEIPQLVNVLKGDMSLVGPRPEQPFFVEQLSRDVRLYSLRHSVKAGITGWAQINYPYGASKADAIRKLEYELYYIKNYSFLQDLSILLQTVRVLFWPPRAN